MPRFVACLLLPLVFREGRVGCLILRIADPHDALHLHRIFGKTSMALDQGEADSTPFQRLICLSCGFSYDEALGLPITAPPPAPDGRTCWTTGSVRTAARPRAASKWWKSAMHQAGRNSPAEPNRLAPSRLTPGRLTSREFEETHRNREPRHAKSASTALVPPACRGAGGMISSAPMPRGHPMSPGIRVPSPGASRASAA
jgi:hypothetical protein